MARCSTSGTEHKGLSRSAAIGAVLAALSVPAHARGSDAPPPAVAGAQHNRWLLNPRMVLRGDGPVVRHDPARLIKNGVRIELQASGAVVQAHDLLPSAVRVLELPPWLGPGFVFFAELERTTWIWRSDTWTGPLLPLAQVAPPVQELSAGFDRLYLSLGPGLHPRALDPSSGQLRDLGPLPISSGYRALAFASPWLGAVVTDILGTQVTFDAGGSWHPLGIDDLGLRISAAHGQIELHSNHNRWQLNEHGALTSDASVNDEQASGDRVTRAGETNSLLSSSLLAIALSQGFQDGPNHAIVVTHGTLSRVHLADGKVVRQHPVALSKETECQGVRMGVGPGFVCTGRQGTALYRFEKPFALRRVLRFSQPRSIAVTGSGGMVITGSCEPDAVPNTPPGRYCTFDGQVTRQLALPTGHQYVALLQNGAVIALTPPRPNTPGQLTQVAGPGKSNSSTLKTHSVNKAAQALLETGLWLNPLHEGASGELATWVIGAQHFIGVKVKPNGSVETSEVRSNLPDALFNGALGVVLTAGGVGYESRNHGFDWTLFKLPPGLSAVNPYSAEAGPLLHQPRGCSLLGCVFGEWLRVGLGSFEPSFTEAAKPPLLPPVNRAMPHWAMDCHATGINHTGRVRPTEPRKVPSAPRSQRGSVAASPDAVGTTIENSAWRDFWGTAPPQRSPSDLVLDVGNDEHRAQVRGYAWGPATSAWAHTAQWLVRVTDRFAVDSVWSSAASPIAWSTPPLTAELFGQTPSAGPTEWSIAADATGKAGLLRIATRNHQSLFVVEEGRPIQRVDHKGTLELHTRLPSFARVLGERYLGHSTENTFSLYRLEGNKLTLLQSYPLLAPDAVRVELVASRAADALAIWIKTQDRGWFFFPLERGHFSAAPPTHIPLSNLGGAPPVCGAESQGWQVRADVPLATLSGSTANTWLSFSAETAKLRVRQVEARIIVSDQGLCVAAIAGEIDDSSQVPSTVQVQPASRSERVPATLTDRATERRFGFKCSR